MAEANTSNTAVSNTVITTEQKAETETVVTKIEETTNVLLKEVNEFKAKVEAGIDSIDVKYLQEKVESKANELLEDAVELKDKVVNKIENAKGPGKYIIYAVIGVFALGLIAAII